MTFPERRHLERMEPTALLYVDLKPDNGGVVLNLTKDGLCFQSVAPLNKHQLLAFSFDEQNSRCDGVGEVVWIDKSRKCGGLRFTRATAEAKDGHLGAAEEIQRRAHEPAMQLPSDAEEQRLVTTALAPIEMEKSSPVHVALFREANYLPSIDLRPRRARRGWVQKVLILVLAIYAMGASIALYRYSRNSGSGTPLPATELAAPMKAKPSTLTGSTSENPAIPPATVAAKSPGGIRVAPDRVGTVAVKSVAISSYPTRPVIQSAPVEVEYPEVSAASRSGQVNLRLLINTAGKVEAVKVVSGESSLIGASVRAARQWRYRPLQSDGHAVPSETHVKLRFVGDEAVSISFRD